MKEEHKFLQTTRFSFEISNFLRWIFCKKRGIRRNEGGGKKWKKEWLTFFFEEKFNFVVIEVECANCISKDFSFWLKNILGNIR